ncbi:MAG: prepilin-type N-terminal cleavage/methylation domain-containing protein [Rhodocyclaceae bacterium]|nr:prepilin-type N-terminal cleavage/methylation domain-containing protein [Rhodocyclaceae bacterium]
MKHSAQRAARGFTLIELVIVTVIIAIMASALTPLAINSLSAYRETVENIEVLDKLRYATERIAREVRAIHYASSTTNPSTCTGGTTDRFCITTTMPTTGSATSLGFRMCSNYDFTTIPTSCSSFRTVTIAKTGATVTLAYSDVNSGAAQVLIDEVNSLTFNFFQNNGVRATTAGNVSCVTAATPACVGYIEIELRLTHNVADDYTQRTRVSLRTPPI